jgi:hypothetical protein
MGNYSVLLVMKGLRDCLLRLLLLLCVGSLAVSGPCSSAFWPAGWVPTNGGLRVDPLLLITRVIDNMITAAAAGLQQLTCSLVCLLLLVMLCGQSSGCEQLPSAHRHRCIIQQR